MMVAIVVWRSDSRRVGPPPAALTATLPAWLSVYTHMPPCVSMGSAGMPVGPWSITGTRASTW